MTIEANFSEAQQRVQSLSKAPSTEDLLRLYALYKQGSLGDCAGKRPGILEMRGRAKFDAWSKLRGMNRNDAQASYIQLVDELERRYGT